MLFGTIKKQTLNSLFIAPLIALTAFSCKESHKKSESIALFPESGSTYKLGDEFKAFVKTANLPDSVQYYVDGKLIETKKDTSNININTSNLSLGTRIISAKVFSEGKEEEIQSNITILTPRVPKQFGFNVVKTYKHDTSSYTQGLEYHDGIFYESDGEYGASSLRKVSVEGKVLKQIDLDKRYFAEGITIIGDKILMLTYKEKVMFEYDKNTFELLRTIPYNHAEEGWGLTFDGNVIYNTDGTNRIFKLNKDTYQPEGFIEVYDNKGPVNYLNEMEWIDGKIYANIYTSDLIAIIDPKTGEVEAYINLSGIRKGSVEDESQDVLNGIAWDAKGKRLFVTGKKWSELYQITLKEH
ncbi:glutamine cyclotransferase [Pseudopedobacter saltans DSM 12145]|uniref:Glutamine cyclotransferase n=1 Tax=Pseudopedobacter saltans (strain ATCC 51119 / DSM 12145 / JCM 21818 / CCUG 39354 / LMG 10337 / NBRC 100064 / NCIMB 13643) TaxID=762903 RepID=F0S6B1_PSESL|nr:glutaminyl-peptide cyclotransferase [Pseudopedobacter saltans]ADY53225.1 glutamine cyclotransferase [Pseudopedobacter saltans DSM 12145]